MSFFEIIMLICFGVGWPISIVKSLRTGLVSGKSPLFMSIVIVGYASGILHKIFYSTDWVIILYGINFMMVTFDLLIYIRLSKRTGCENPS